MKTALFALLVCFSSFALYAQEVGSLPSTKSIYVELGGAGLPYSFNYDFRFDRSRVDSWGMRLGFGGYALDGDSFFSLPVQVNKLMGKGSHYFEIGVGATLLAFSEDDDTYCIDGYYDPDSGQYICSSYESDGYNFILDVDGSPSLMGTLNFGYRRVPADGGFTWKININPIFNNNGFWPLYGGVAFGYAF